MAGTVATARSSTFECFQEAKAGSELLHILSLPSEILQHLLSVVTTPSFLQIILTCRRLYDLAQTSRAVLLDHLHQLPGLKLGLSDPISISTPDLLVTLRRRAATHLYGVNFTADCTDYAFRHATLDANACVLAEGREYINIALALKESLTVRLYGGRCVRKEIIESPYGDGRGKILKILQWNTTITVLYQWIDEDEIVLGGGSALNDPRVKKKSETISRSMRRRRRSLSPAYPAPPESPSPSRSHSPARSSTPTHTFVEEATESSSPLKFHLLHYNAYSFSKPIFFSIPRYKEDLVPISIAVSGRLKCAILWDREGSIKPSPDAAVVLYTAEYVPRGEEGTYDGRQIWPLRRLTSRDPIPIRIPTTTAPRSIAFFHEGSRLALFAPGGIVPYEVISTTNASLSANLSNSVLLTKGMRLWTVDRPFWGDHETYTEKVERDRDDDDDQEQEDRTYCQHTYLCLGTAIVDGLKIAGILRSRSRRDHDDCAHLVNYDGMPHTNANSKVVARLWGWKESLSTLPGVVAWSGTGAWSSPVRFVAIADWDRIFIWAVAVGELSEDFEGDADDDNSDDGDGSDDDDDTATTATATGTTASTASPNIATAKGKGKQREEEGEQDEVPGYYEREWDVNLLASVVVLSPIVLSMPNGGVIRRMVWSRHSEGDESEDEVEDVDEEEADFVMIDEVLGSPYTEVSHPHVAAAFAQDPNTSAWSRQPSSWMPRNETDVDPGRTWTLSPIAIFAQKPDSGAWFYPSQRVERQERTVDKLDEEEETAKGGPGTKKGKGKRRSPPGLRLKVLTDRGISIWELGAAARGRRKKGWLDEVVI